MAVLPIRTVGDPVLRTPAEPVTVFDEALRRLVDNMIDTMYDAPGVGLAAPQVGVGLRLFVYDVDWDTDDDPDSDDPDGSGSLDAVPRRPLVVANPVLETGGGQQHGQEGCLSVPKLYYSTTRADSATVRGFDASGAPVEYSGTGLLARCFQHEVDHLDGTLYLDRLTGDARRAAQRTLRENGPGGESGDGKSGPALPAFFRSLRRPRP